MVFAGAAANAGGGRWDQPVLPELDEAGSDSTSVSSRRLGNTAAPIRTSRMSGSSKYTSERSSKQGVDMLHSFTNKVLGVVGKNSSDNTHYIIQQDFKSRVSRVVKVKPMCLWAYRIAVDDIFNYTIQAVIVLNAVQLGIAADVKGGEWDNVWAWCEHFFTAVIVFEVALKAVAFGRTFFRDEWNYLDIFVAVVSVVDRWFLVVVFNQKIQVLKMFRMFRLLRLFKLCKMVPQLELVVEGMISSFRSIIWVYVLLAIFLYVWGICCVEMIGDKQVGYTAYEEDASIMEESAVRDFNNYAYFGNLSRAMVSLFSVMALFEWSTIVRPVWEKQGGMVIVFILLVVFTSFGVLNVIVGVVVDKTTAQMNQLRAKDVERRRRRQMAVFERISDIMFELDTDDDKRISMEEMEQAALNDHLHDLLGCVDLPHGFSYREFHEMLDVDGSGFLSKNEFTHGMLRLVFSDQFQRDCTQAVNLGKLRTMQMRLRTELEESLRTEMQRHHDSLMHELQKLRKLITNGEDQSSPRWRSQDSRRRENPAGSGFMSEGLEKPSSVQSFVANPIEIECLADGWHPMDDCVDADLEENNHQAEKEPKLPTAPGEFGVPRQVNSLDGVSEPEVGSRGPGRPVRRDGADDSTAASPRRDGGGDRSSGGGHVGHGHGIALGVAGDLAATWVLNTSVQDIGTIVSEPSHRPQRLACCCVSEPPPGTTRLVDDNVRVNCV